jgi:hypothetical protein
MTMLYHDKKMVYFFQRCIYTYTELLLPKFKQLTQLIHIYTYINQIEFSKEYPLKKREEHTKVNIIRWQWNMPEYYSYTHIIIMT